MYFWNVEYNFFQTCQGMTSRPSQLPIQNTQSLTVSQHITAQTEPRPSSKNLEIMYNSLQSPRCFVGFQRKWPNGKMAQHGPTRPNFASVAKPSGCTPLCVGCSNVEPLVEATWYTKSSKCPSKSTKSNKWCSIPPADLGACTQDFMRLEPSSDEKGKMRGSSKTRKQHRENLDWISMNPAGKQCPLADKETFKGRAPYKKDFEVFFLFVPSWETFLYRCPSKINHKWSISLGQSYPKNTTRNLNYWQQYHATMDTLLVIDVHPNVWFITVYCIPHLGW